MAQATGSDSEDIARLYFALSERYEVDRILTRITQLPRDDRWSALARAALRSDLYGALVGMTRRVIEATPDITDAARAHRRRGRPSRPRASPAPRPPSTRSATLENFDLATLSVALRTIRTLVQQGA